MYGGNGVTPASARSSSTGAGPRLSTTQRPSPSGSMQRSGQPGPLASLSSTSSRRGRPRSSTSQRSLPAASAHRKRTSMRPPVARWKKLRAGNTRVSLRTSTSPSRSSAGQVGEDAVLHLAAVAAHDQEARGIARLRGRLGDELVGKVVVQVGERKTVAVAHAVLPRAARGARARPPTCWPRTRSTADGRGRAGGSPCSCRGTGRARPDRRSRRRARRQRPLRRR